MEVELNYKKATGKKVPKSLIYQNKYFCYTLENNIAKLVRVYSFCTSLMLDLLVEIHTPESFTSNDYHHKYMSPCSSALSTNFFSQ